jgi:tRNA threonylcarbamoyl adenosine modification protein YeaZ
VIVLGFDSTAPTLTVGVAEAGKSIGRWDLAPDRHRGDALDSLIDRALADAGLTRGDVGGLVLVIGPGSLTATRIGWATACGWALAGGIPITGWSTPTVQWRKWVQGEYQNPAFAEVLESGAVPYCLIHHRGGEFYSYEFTRESAPVRPAVITLEEWHPVAATRVALLGPGMLSRRSHWESLASANIAIVPESDALVGGDVLACWGTTAIAEGQTLLPEVSPLDYGLPPTFRKVS